MDNATMNKFRKSLEAKAAKCGIDVSNVVHAGVTTDRTWGDRCGLVFYGGTQEVNERVARYFEAWLRKQPRKSSYEAQQSLSFAGEMYFVRYSNNAQGWYLGAPKESEPMTLSSGFVVECVEMARGVAVNTTYYPCAD